MKNRLRWTYRANRPRKEKMFFKTNIQIYIDLETIAMFLFDKSDTNNDDFEWYSWTAPEIIKKIKETIRWSGLEGLYVDDPDCEVEYQWNMQPTFAQDWFVEQAALLFPEIDITSSCNKNNKNRN